nr:uncharacterized mitochondrial protein AtMg00810-like [Aegilops tauschii subsp. strangulata]
MASAAPPAPSTPAVSASSSPAPVAGPVTRARMGVFRPSSRYASDDYIHAASTSEPSPLPSSVRAALHDPLWMAATQEKFDALLRNRTWQLVPRPRHANRAGIDFTDTFSPVVKPGIIRTVLHLAVSCAWPVHQMDVSNAFLHGHLEEQVFCSARLVPTHRGVSTPARVPLHPLGASLFVYHQGSDTAYLLLYVDDIILTACTAGLLSQLTDRLRAEFAIKDLGPLHYFLGVEVVRRPDGFFVHQRKYAHELLDRAGMLNFKPAATPVDTKAKLSAMDGSPASDAAFYRSIVGALQYLTLTRPEIQYAMQQVFLHMHAPRDVHWAAVKRILRYICGTMDLGVMLYTSTDTALTAYSDADWAGCPNTCRSTQGIVSSLDPHSSRGRPSGSLQSLAPVLRLSIVRWPTSSPSVRGFASS